MTDHAEPTSLADVHPAQRFCGVRQSVIDQARAQTLAWRGITHLTYVIADRVPGIPEAVFRAIVADAFARWSRVCNLTFEEVFDARAAKIVILTRSIDGRSGTLAEAELPPGDNRTLRMWLDLGERWWAAADLSGPTAQNLIDLLAVIAHEAGHLLGLSHEETRGVQALMDPYYDPNVRQPLAWDIAEAVRRYGQPKQQPEPVPQPQPPVDFVPPESVPIVFSAFGATYAGPVPRKL